MKLAGKPQIVAVTAGMLSLASRGLDWEQFIIGLSLDPLGLQEIARETAEEEFETMPGLPPGVPARGRLAGRFSESQGKLIRKSLVETYILALQTGVVLERTRLYDPEQLDEVRADAQAARKIAADWSERNTDAKDLAPMLDRIAEFLESVKVDRPGGNGAGTPD